MGLCAAISQNAEKRSSCKSRRQNPKSARKGSREGKRLKRVLGGLGSQFSPSGVRHPGRSSVRKKSTPTREREVRTRREKETSCARTARLWLGVCLERDVG